MIKTLLRYRRLNYHLFESFVFSRLKKRKEKKKLRHISIPVGIWLVLAEMDQNSQNRSEGTGIQTKVE